MRAPSRAVVLAALLAAAPAAASAKDAKPPPKPKTGTFSAPGTAPVAYVRMAVPDTYDPKRWYPLAFVLHPETGDPAASKPDPFVDVFARALLPKGWIVAGPKVDLYDNETSINPLDGALRKVLADYHVDERRVVLVGLNAGAMMGWRLATRTPARYAAVMAFDGEVPPDDRPMLKALAGKRAYLFRGEKDTYYTHAMLETDRRNLEAHKLQVTVFEKKEWGDALPTGDMDAIAAWMDAVQPVGPWPEKAAAAEKAIAGKDLLAAQKAVAELLAELKRSPYPAYQERAEALAAEIQQAGRAMLEEARAAAEADPLDGLARMEAAVRATKGVKGLEDEARKAFAALQKSPAVVEAVKKKEAEAAGSSYMEKAAAAETKGDLARALELYRKAAALALFSKRDDAAAKATELEGKVGGK